MITEFKIFESNNNDILDNVIQLLDMMKSKNLIKFNNIELVREFNSETLVQMFKERTSLLRGKNDVEYFEKIDVILEDYGKRTDARTKEMSYALIKIIRIIDGRDFCNDSDLDVLKYLLESIDNKIEVADTNEFKINGPHFVDDKEFENSQGVLPQNAFGYSASLEDFNK